MLNSLLPGQKWRKESLEDLEDLEDLDGLEECNFGRVVWETCADNMVTTQNYSAEITHNFTGVPASKHNFNNPLSKISWNCSLVVNGQTSKLQSLMLSDVRTNLYRWRCYKRMFPPKGLAKHSVTGNVGWWSNYVTPTPLTSTDKAQGIILMKKNFLFVSSDSHVQCQSHDFKVPSPS